MTQRVNFKTLLQFLLSSVPGVFAVRFLPR